MTNDTTTLNGALQELGETMAANLVAQGVTGASASDGLTTLAAKILDIQTGSSCYHIEFSESSYTATGGSATLELTLQQNYAPLSGATVSVTGSDSSSYTGITNSSGVAEITVTGVSAETTFTASYSNATATCTVTVPNIIFQDDCSSSTGLSNYTFQEIESGTCTGTLTYDSTMNAYKMSSTSGGVKMWCINDLNGLTQLKLTLELYLPSSVGSDSAVSCEAATTTKSSVGLYIEKSSTKLHYHRFQNSTWKENMVISNSGGSKNTWLKVVMTINGTSLNTKVFNGDTQLVSNDYTLSNTSSDFNTSSYRRYGPGIGWSNGAIGYVRNIKAESL